MARALASAVSAMPLSQSLLIARPVAGVGLTLPARGRLDGADDRQAVGGGEVPVALVLGRARP